jgi:hypothetical protein
VNREDVRMIERRSHLRFSLKAALSRSGGKFLRQELDRHRPLEPGVRSAVHHAHAPFPQKFFDGIRTELFAGNQLCAGGMAQQVRGKLERRSVKRTRNRIALRQQRLDLATQFAVAFACLGKETSTPV